MAKIVFRMDLSLDGCFDFQGLPVPDAELFCHRTEHVGDLAGTIYGRQMYEVVRYWYDDHTDWTSEQHDFVVAWRRQPKWVVSRSSKSVGPNATLVADDVEVVIRELKAKLTGEISASEPTLAQSLSDMGLVDEFRLYLQPVVVGRGKPFFSRPRPPLRLVSSERIGGEGIRLTYAPA